MKYVAHDPNVANGEDGNEGASSPSCRFSDMELRKLRGSIELLTNTMHGIQGDMTTVVKDLIGPATNKDYIPLKTHVITMIATIGLLGGIQVFNTYMAAMKATENLKTVIQSIPEIKSDVTSKQN